VVVSRERHTGTAVALNPPAEPQAATTSHHTPHNIIKRRARPTEARHKLLLNGSSPPPPGIRRSKPKNKEQERYHRQQKPARGAHQVFHHKRQLDCCFIETVKSTSLLVAVRLPTTYEGCNEGKHQHRTTHQTSNTSTIRRLFVAG